MTRHMIAAHMMMVIRVIGGGATRDERGGGGITLEQVVWIVAGLGAALLVTALVLGVIKARMAGIS